MSDAINPEHYKRLPAEAIEIIESAINNAPSNQDAYLHGQVLKYILRCWNKNGIEDLRKAKWYLDRLIDSFDESEAEQLATVEVAVEVTVEVTGEVTGEVKPPDGWRWIEVGEVFRKGDTTNTIEPIPEQWVGTQCVVTHVALRRNRFEVGEKVVRVSEPRGIVFQVKCAFLDNSYGLATEGGLLDRLSGNSLAPYIEETT